MIDIPACGLGIEMSLTPDTDVEVPTLSLLARVVQGGLPVVEATVTVRVDR